MTLWAAAALLAAQTAAAGRFDPPDLAEVPFKALSVDQYSDAVDARAAKGDYEGALDIIAKALAKNPKKLLCDEPTGALDYQTGKAILKLLQDMCRERGMTVIVITHNSALTPMADRVIKIKNGKVSRMTMNDHPTPIEEIEW